MRIVNLILILIAFIWLTVLTKYTSSMDKTLIEHDLVAPEVEFGSLVNYKLLTMQAIGQVESYSEDGKYITTYFPIFTTEEDYHYYYNSLRVFIYRASEALRQAQDAIKRGQYGKGK